MLIDLVLVIIALGSLGGIIFFVFKKVPILRKIDTGRLKNLQQQQVKTKITESRLRRRLEGLGSRLGMMVAPVIGAVKKYQDSLTKKVQGFEEELKQKLLQQTAGSQPLQDLLKKADEAAKQEDWESAERMYLEVIRQSPRERQAYQGLGDIYLSQHDYEQAQELYSYLVSHNSEFPDYRIGLAQALIGQGQLERAKQEYLSYLEKVVDAPSQIYFELAQIYKDLGQVVDAWQAANMARNKEAGNPRILDFFIEISILNGRPTDAQSALDALREANPDNKKISQFDKSIRELIIKLKPRKKIANVELSKNVSNGEIKKHRKGKKETPESSL